MRSKIIDQLSYGNWNRKDAVIIVTSIDSQDERGQTLCCRVEVISGNVRRHQPLNVDELFFGNSHGMTLLADDMDIFGAMLYQTDQQDKAEEEAYPMNSIATRVRRIVQNETADVIYGNAVLLPLSLFPKYPPIQQAYDGLLQEFEHWKSQDQ